MGELYAYGSEVTSVFQLREALESIGIGTEEQEKILDTIHQHTR